MLACMHGGCRVYHLDIQVVTVAGTAEEIDSEKEEEQRYIVTELGNVHQIDENNDKHLAYGVDVLSALKGAEGETVDFTIASCSFYDNLVQVWNCKL